MERRQKLTLAMDTTIHITAVGADAPALERAVGVFHAVERVCSRFRPESEVAQLSARVGRPIPVSPLLFETLQFALAMAEATDGAFDPTVGRQLQRYGFNRNYVTGEVAGAGCEGAASYRDLELDATARTVTLHRPLLIDLGAVAKGLAVDLAARELAECPGFVIDAGGDVFAGGRNEAGEPWRIGIQHPLQPGESICVLHLTDAAVCTSGSYERRSQAVPGAHHLIDPRSGQSRRDLLSCTVVAPHAMLADAMSTAAFVLGIAEGLPQVEAAGLDALFIDADLGLHMTETMARYIK